MPALKIAMARPNRRAYIFTMTISEVGGAMILVKAAFDPETSVWFVESSDMPGLNVEGASLDELRAKIPVAVEDLLEAAGEVGAFDVPIEIVAHASARARGRVTA